MKTTNYVLMEAYTHLIDRQDSQTLPAGSFVRPMDPRWVPKEVKERHWINHDKEVFCYTRLGIIPIPRKIIRVADY